MARNLLLFVILVCLARGAFALDMCVPGDNQTSTAVTGTFFDSGGAGGNYDNRESCSLLIQPTGGGTITLTFSAFDTQGAQDILTIYDGTNTSGTPLGTFFGALATPFTVSATSGAMFIDWSTNPGGNDPGWEAGWAAAVASPLDHYSISHAGTGITCLTEDITITAHDSSHAAAAPGAVNLSLSTSTLKGDWVGKVSGGGNLVDAVAGDGAATYNIPAGETNVVLRFNYTDIGAGNSETFSINVTDGSVVETGGVATTALDDPGLTVSLVGLEFTNIAAQISGKDSNVAPVSSIILRAVRASDSDPSVCDPLLSNQSFDVELGTECRNPGSCNGGLTRINGTVIATNNDNGGAQTAGYGSVNLPFDADGDADLVVNYSDAGQVQLHARFNLPLDDGSGLPSGDYALGSSNDFVVKPAGLCVVSTGTNADCVSGDASCSLFKRAGEVFNLTVSGVDWQAAGEADTDFCSGNNVTPNFQLTNIALSPNLVAPSPGANTNLGDPALDIAAADMGSHTTAIQGSSEVGVFTITATPPTYFGETIAASTSANIGRFYPDRFELSLGAVTEACATGVFTYLDQDFSVDYRLTALNTGGIITANYRDAFIDFVTPPANVTYGAVDTGAAVALTARLANPPTTFVWNDDGTGDLAADLNLARLVPPDGPYATDIGALPTDADGVTLATVDLDVDVDLDTTNDHRLIGQTTQRYGRLFINNAFGPEVLALSMPVRAEFWNSTAFIVNMMDSCTTLTDAPPPGGAPADPDSWGDFDLSVYTDSLAPGETTPAYSAILNGTGALDLSAPGVGNTGAVRIDVRGPAWLRFDYDANPVTPDEDAHAEATFGQYRGNDRVIYWRELIPVQ